MWYQESCRRSVIPEPIEEAHPSLQAHFRQLAERLARINWDDLVRETVAFGSPDTVARKIEAMRDAGVGHVLCWMNFGGLPQDKIRRSMELFAREVMPHFRDWVDGYSASHTVSSCWFRKWLGGIVQPRS